MSTVANSAVANTYFGTNGTAISSTTQPNNTRSRIAAPGDSTQNPKAVVTIPTEDEMSEGLSIGKSTFPLDILTGYDSLGSLNLVDTADLGTTYSTECQEGTTFTGISEGDIAIINGAYLSTVRSTAQETIVYDQVAVAAASVTSINVLKRDAFKQHRNDIVVGYTNHLKGPASDSFFNNYAITGGATSPDRGVNSTEVLRTRRTGTAIRAGYWDEFDGEFSTAPTVADDSSATTITADKAYTTSRITFTSGKIPSQVTR